MQDDSAARESRNQAVSQKTSETDTEGEKRRGARRQDGDAGEARTRPASDPAEAARRSEQKAERQKRRQEQQGQRRQATANDAEREGRADGAGRNKPNKPKVSYKSVRAQAAANSAAAKPSEPGLQFVARGGDRRTGAADAQKAPDGKDTSVGNAATPGSAQRVRQDDAIAEAGAKVGTDRLAQNPVDGDTARDTRAVQPVADQDQDKDQNKDKAQTVTEKRDQPPQPQRARAPQPARAPQAKQQPRAPGGGAQAQPAVVRIKPQAGPARARGRHIILLLTFLIMVVAPVAAGGYYLFTIAVDQYHSTVGFSVRKEETNTPVELLGGITNLSGSSTSDTDILYEFIQSQEMVEAVDKKLDLRAIWSKPEFDPVFAIDADVSIEDLMTYWRRMVRISYDGGTGLIELRVLAFEPQDAQDIGREVFAESSRMINDISAIARQDATRYAQDELEKSVQRLKDARLAITEFRSRTQIVDPTTDLQGQMTLLANLQGQLAEALIEMDLLRETTREGDPRITQAQRRIDVIGVRIDEERKKIGVSGSDSEGRDYATLFSEYERLAVDREFAEQSYIAALTAYDGAVSEAQRQSRYLAAYVQPTKAQTSQYPQKEMLTALLALFSFLVWAILVLIYYSIRDRR